MRNCEFTLLLFFITDTWLQYIIILLLFSFFQVLFFFILPFLHFFLSLHSSILSIIVDWYIYYRCLRFLDIRSLLLYSYKDTSFYISVRTYVLMYVRTNTRWHFLTQIFQKIIFFHAEWLKWCDRCFLQLLQQIQQHKYY